MISALTPPHNLEAERTVLGACILDKEALSTTIGILKSEDFYEPKHRTLYDILLNMHAGDKVVDYITVPAELNDRGILDRLGGQLFIDSLVMNVATTANTAYHAKLVREYAVRRKIIAAGNEIASLAVDFDKDILAIIDEAEKLLYEAGQNKDSSEFAHIRELIGPVFLQILERKNSNKTSEVTGFSSGFSDLDALIGGFQPGSLNIIAARPSMGKTSFAMNIAQFGGGKTNSAVLVFSLEMPREQIVQRMISAQSGVNLTSIMHGTFDTNDFQKVKEACEELSKREIYINDSTTLSAMEFRARCRRFKIRHPELALVVVDYLQLMSYAETRKETRNQEVSDISRMLKATARELNCPVIALSQLSREAEKRNDKKPQLADLRDSGAIEQDADLVMMLYREDYYSEHENNDMMNSKADVRVAKNRNGGTGVISLTFQREITRFQNYGEA